MFPFFFPAYVRGPPPPLFLMVINDVSAVLRMLPLLNALGGRVLFDIFTPCARVMDGRTRRKEPRVKQPFVDAFASGIPVYRDKHQRLIGKV